MIIKPYAMYCVWPGKFLVSCQTRPYCRNIFLLRANCDKATENKLWRACEESVITYEAYLLSRWRVWRCTSRCYKQRIWWKYTRQTSRSQAMWCKQGDLSIFVCMPNIEIAYRPCIWSLRATSTSSSYFIVETTAKSNSCTSSGLYANSKLLIPRGRTNG